MKVSVRLGNDSSCGSDPDGGLYNGDGAYSDAPTAQPEQR